MFLEAKNPPMANVVTLIMSCNARAVKTYSTSNRLARFLTENIFFLFAKTLSLSETPVL
jgi:hypothetical protein